MRAGFTLIELLVVVTIIVVLLALLTPALDRAIYQAELTVCAAQMRGVVGGVSSYAAANRRRYPARMAMEGQEPLLNYKPHQIRDFYGAGSANVVDDRRFVEEYFALRSLVDPLCEPVDLSDAANDLNTSLWSSYALWWGWKYIPSEGPAGAGMKKLGDRFSWTDTTVTPARTYRMPYLISDQDNAESFDGLTRWNSHPDHDGLLIPFHLQNEGINETDGVVGVAGNALFVTISVWWMQGTHERGDVDYNLGSADGSVVRYADVRWNEWDTLNPAPDGRFIGVPDNMRADNWPQEFYLVPRP